MRPVLGVAAPSEERGSLLGCLASPTEAGGKPAVRPPGQRTQLPARPQPRPSGTRPRPHQHADTWFRHVDFVAAGGDTVLRKSMFWRKKDIYWRPLVSLSVPADKGRGWRSTSSPAGGRCCSSLVAPPAGRGGATPSCVWPGVWELLPPPLSGVCILFCSLFSHSHPSPPLTLETHYPQFLPVTSQLRND